IEPTNAVERHAPTLGLGTRRLEAEAITCITGKAAERRIEELPAEVAPALGKVRKHLLDGRAACARPEKVVVVGAIRREEIGQRAPLAGGCRRCEPLHQFSELHGLLPLPWGAWASSSALCIVPRPAINGDRWRAKQGSGAGVFVTGSFCACNHPCSPSKAQDTAGGNGAYAGQRVGKAPGGRKRAPPKADRP